MRGKKVFLVLSLALVFALVACSGNSDPGQQATEDDGQSEESTTVTVWHYFTGKQQALFDELAKEYSETHDNVKVTHEYIPFDQMKQQLSVGTAGDALPDMVFIDGVDHAAFAEMGILEDLTDRINKWGEADNYLEGPLKSTMYEGKYFGLPYETNALGLFYNQGMLDEAGITEPPSTWDELEEAAQKLTKDGKQGFAISAVKSEEATFQFYPFLLSAGADYDNLGSKEAEAALSFLTGLIKDGSMSNSVINATQDDIAREFAAGNVAMMVNGPWNIARIQEEAPDLNFGIAPIPKDQEAVSVLGGGNLAIVKGGNVDAAWDYLAWLESADVLEEFTANTGVFPPRADVLETSDHWKSDEYLNSFIPILEVAEPRGPSPKWPQISEAIQVAIQNAMTDTMSPGEALKEAAEKVETIVNE